jgi:hypothetical protein
VRRYLLAAAVIISLLVASPTLADKWVYHPNPNGSGQVLAPKDYRAKYNPNESRWELAPSGARLVYDMGLKQWRYIPGIIPSK